jgi:hypothetical protein
VVQLNFKFETASGEYDTYCILHLQREKRQNKVLRAQTEKSLTLIRAAGGVYDFRNFKEIYLCNGLSSDLQNSCIPRKTSREYILLNTLERRTAFSASYRSKRAKIARFFRRFWLFRTAVKGIYDLSTTTPGPSTPPANSRRTKQFWSAPRGL